jgi:hypothetical protein
VLIDRRELIISPPRPGADVTIIAKEAVPVVTQNA